MLTSFNYSDSSPLDREKMDIAMVFLGASWWLLRQTARVQDPNSLASGFQRIDSRHCPECPDAKGAGLQRLAGEIAARWNLLRATKLWWLLVLNEGQ